MREKKNKNKNVNPEPNGQPAESLAKPRKGKSVRC